ncbi:DUF2987 domain-containing protein [Pseudoalteromonas piscicida]|uniref:DUF2987 domain-containing protein n=1 Tax=Pseudoalteromonas piscicida TaxID=43662 RepID=A0AAD0RH08_PSEO7|nr:DUF2987 domain-containing protein [Pseudoalteromonas piscicida]ASD66720.1 hypothetical protein B1L02_06610 [Pseudoalteromonas piscicida]AXQ97652.1 DUF2987 domain-containing protein [Pseudoalteromonas piscicida]AXR02562.1 DUF2987 domain-containing protein [Pseudoalteromonas piscicida]
MKNKIVLVLTMVLWSAIASAKTVTFAYDSFYDRLKVVNKGEFEFARVGFYLVDTVSMQACKITTGNIVTEEASFPLSYTDEAQLLLPFDKELDKDKAKVVIETKGANSDCQLKMQIEAELFNTTSLSKSDLYKMQMEFEELLADLSGFFIKNLLSFLLPEQQGVIVTFGRSQNVIDATMQCESQVCQITVPKAWSNDNTHFADSADVKSVQPWLAL